MTVSPQSTVKTARATAVLLALAALLACGRAKESSPEDAAATARDDADLGSDARAGDRDAAPTDAGTAPAHDANLSADGGVSSGGSSDAGGRDAGGLTEAGTAGRQDSLAARVCGDGGGFASPFPAGVNKLSAEAVGAEVYGFIEGPVWIADQGVLLFSDMDMSGPDAQGPSARIRRLRPPATFDVFAPSSNSNGLALSNEGALLAATHDNQGLSSFRLDTGVRTPITVLVDGKHFNSPNDLTVRSDGTVYFTDPDWQLGPRARETGITGVYRVAPPLDLKGANNATLVEGTLLQPNGIALSPDEETLYVGFSGSEIWKYDVASDGTLAGRTKFATIGGSNGSDGMTIDCAGNLYVTSRAVEVFAPSGTKLGEISLAGTPSNVAFGGADRKTLFITGGAHLYAVKMNVPGLPY